MNETKTSHNTVTPYPPNTIQAVDATAVCFCSTLRRVALACLHASRAKLLPLQPYALLNPSDNLPHFSECVDARDDHSLVLSIRQHLRGVLQSLV